MPQYVLIDGPASQVMKEAAEFRVAVPPTFGDTFGSEMARWAASGETAAVAKASDDRQERLAKALRDNLHRRKAQSRARSAVHDTPHHMTDAPAAVKTPPAGTERDHGQAED